MGACNGQQPESLCNGCHERAQRIAELEAEVRRLHEQAQVQQKLHQAQVEQLHKQIQDLSGQVQELARAAKRQAAPFSKGPPKAHPKKPGRKPGEGYGNKAHRRVPAHIDEHYRVALPAQCPTCQGSLRYTGLASQYQVDLPTRPVGRQFDVECGLCRRCGRAVRGLHPLQSSQAGGCCASQLGPHAQALLVILNKDMGLPYGKMARLLRFLGLELSRGGACQAVLRAARKAQGTYQAAVERLREGRQISSDETGWRLGGQLAWLHVAVSESLAAYLVSRQRGREGIGRLLGDFAGTLVHDGFRGYDWFCWPRHQTCNQHLLRRCAQMLRASRGRDFVRRVRRLLVEGLATRDARDAGQLTADEAATKAGDLERRLGKLVERRKGNKANETFAKHLRQQAGKVFAYLKALGLDATNWRAELALRFAVVNRKVWGGNRTPRGAVAQGVLQTILKTAQLRGLDAMTLLCRMLCEPQPHRRPALLLDSS